VAATLGPANDVGIEHEIRAAEIAQSGYRFTSGGVLRSIRSVTRSMSWDEGAGWDAWKSDGEQCDMYGCEVDEQEFLAGWLAAAIVADSEGLL